MATIKKSEIKKMSAKEANAKIISLERALLELEGEGKREKKKPVKKAIAKLKTQISIIAKAEKAGAMKGKGLNTKSAPINTPKK